jgi:hypothetical protein
MQLGQLSAAAGAAGAACVSVLPFFFAQQPAIYNRNTWEPETSILEHLQWPAAYKSGLAACKHLSNGSQ